MMLKSIHAILLIEDNPGDVRLTLETFRDANKSVRLHLAADGVEAMAFLRRQGAYVLAPRPFDWKSLRAW